MANICTYIYAIYEQLKAYNQIMLGIQKQVDSIDERVKFIERDKK